MEKKIIEKQERNKENQRIKQKTEQNKKKIEETTINSANTD